MKLFVIVGTEKDEDNKQFLEEIFSSKSKAEKRLRECNVDYDWATFKIEELTKEELSKRFLGEF